MTNSYTGDVKTKIPSAKRDELLKMYHSFGPDEAFSQFEMSYAAELDENYILLALNSDKNGKGKSGYSAEHKEWIKKIADAAKLYQSTLDALSSAQAAADTKRREDGCSIGQ